MNPVDPNTGRLPPPLRALAISLVVEAVVPTLNKSRPESPAPAGHGAKDTDGKAASRRHLRGKCDELLALVLQADGPEEAAAYVLRYLPKQLDHAFKALRGR